MPQKKSADKLQAICLNAIATKISDMSDCSLDHVDTACKFSNSVFQLYKLPHTLLPLLLSQLKEKTPLQPFHLDLLLHNHLTHLDLSLDRPIIKKAPLYALFEEFITAICSVRFYFISKRKAPLYAQVADFISARCPRLKYLNLTNCDQIQSRALIRIVKSLPNVETLILRATNTNDAVLSVIGCCCQNLQELDISMCLGVTDIGLTAFCDDLQQDQRFSKLARLDFKQTSVTLKGLLHAIVKLSCLNFIDYNYQLSPFIHLFRNLGNGVFKITSLRLKKIRLNLRYCNLHQQQEEFFKFLGDLFSNVTNVELYIKEPVKLTILKYFGNLKELKIVSSTETPNIDICTFPSGPIGLLKEIGRNLLSLSLSKISNIDISVIGQCCPRLEHLRIDHTCGFTQINPIAEASDVSIFTHLEKLDIECDWINDVDILETHIIQLMLHSYLLKEIRFCNSCSVNDSVFDTVLETNPLSSLKCLVFILCKNISADIIMKIMSLDNSLKSIYVCECYLIAEDELLLLRKRVEDENLELSITD